MGDDLHHGKPVASRNDKYGFDKYKWPTGPLWPLGLEIHIYDDGRVKVGGWHTTATVIDVSNFRAGGSNGSSHVIARFLPTPEIRDLAEDTTVALEPTEDGVTASESQHSPQDDEPDDEAAYERATWEAITECRRLKPPYDPSAWIGMIHRWGAAEAGRRLLISGDIQYGFRRLIAAGRQDLTIEWSALQPR